MRSIWNPAPTPVAVFLLILASEMLQAGDWPRFRGPNGTGISDEKTIPVKWTSNDILWKVALPGKGHSSPVVQGDRLFLQTAAPDASTRTLMCFQASTGKLLWTLDSPGNQGAIHPRSSLASNTPVVDGDRVFTLFWDGKEIQLCAVDLEGKLLWKRDLGKFTSQHGPGHSPMVVDGLVILPNDQDGSSSLMAFDGKSGKTVWEVKRNAFRASYCTPFLRESADGGRELIVASTAGVTGYDPRTGKEHWNYSWVHRAMPLRLVASPIVANGLILANGGDGSGARHAIAIELKTVAGQTEPSLAWENVKSLPYVPTMLARGAYLYSVNDKGIAACHEAKTGKEIWSERLGSDVTASPILIGDRIHATAENGKVYVFDAEPRFHLVGVSSLGENVSATPAVSDGRLFIRGEQHLFCIGKGR